MVIIMENCILVNRLFNYFVHKKEFQPSCTLISEENIAFAERHKLDTLLYDYVLQNSEAQLCAQDELVTLQDRVNRINRYNAKLCSEAAVICSEFQNNGINCIFLKGIGLINKVYCNAYQRYFSDIDILIPPEAKNECEKVLFGLGYKYGYYNHTGFVNASLAEIRYQRLFTHEFYNMCRYDGEDLINVDINFRFSWVGFEKEKLNDIPFEVFFANTVLSEGSIKIPVFADLFNLLHLCCHVYNEAVYFSLDNTFNSEDFTEISLNRLFDIGMLLKRVNLDELFELSRRYCCFHKINYSLKLLNEVLNQNIKLPLIDTTIVYSKKGHVYHWPIDSHTRVFNTEFKHHVFQDVLSEKILND